MVEGEPEGDAKRWAKATSAVAETLIAAMKPGTRIRDLQALARSTYRSAGVPDPDRAIVFFHGLGLSHMEFELMTSDGTARDSSWVLEEGMVAPIHLLYPGGQFDRSWCEEWSRSAATGAGRCSRGASIRSRGPESAIDERGRESDQGRRDQIRGRTKGH